MAPTGRRGDTLDLHAEAAERVRKMEVMQQSRTLIPEQWKPNRADLDAIAGHVFLMGVWHNPRHEPGTVLGPHTGPAAHYLWAVHDQEGYQNPLVAADWTAFLRRLGAYPSPVSFEPHSTVAEPGEAEWVGVAQLDYPPFQVHGWGGSSSEYDRVFAIWGVPPRGTWRHYNAGEANPPAPDLNEDDPIVAPGAMRGSFDDGDPILNRNNTYGFSQQTDCGGPNEPGYDSYTFPGLPVAYDSGPNPCPDSLGNPFTGGSIVRASMWLSDLDVLLVSPPRPRYGAIAPQYRDLADVRFATHGNGGFPGMSWLAAAAADALADFPEVAAFYARVLPEALAQQSATQHVNHVSLRLGPGWRGRIEAQVRDQMVILRGAVTCSTDDLTMGDFVACWPINYLNAWSADYGYLLPEIPVGPGRRGHFEARFTDGTQVPCYLDSAIDGVRRLQINSNFRQQYAAANLQAGQADDITLSFDGVTIPVRWP